MPTALETAIDRLSNGYWNLGSKTESNPGGLGADGHRDNWEPMLAAIGLVTEHVGTQGELADQVLAIQAQITAVANNEANIEAVADNMAAVLAVVADLAAIIAAPDAATAALAGAAASEGFRDEAEGFRDQAQAAAAGVNLPSITAGDSGKALLVNPEGTGYVVGKVASLPALITANTTLAAGQSYRIGGSSALTLTLPAVPAAGDAIQLVDGESISNTVQHTIARNGQTIMGLAEDLTLNVRGIALQLWFTGTTWRLF